jgi:LacI family transcriptional regulator
MSKKPRVLLKDVAAHAGVSVTTASHVLNDVPGKRVSDDTRDRVRSAAAELGYVPDGLARSLRLQRSHTIALVSDEIATTPFAGRIILGAQEAASKHGWILMLVNTGGDAAYEAQEIAALKQRRVDGFLYATMYHRDVTVPAALQDVPVVLLDAKAPGSSCSWAVPDEQTGGRTATEELLRHGHRRIGLVNNHDDIPATRGRLAGYREALVAAGITPDDSLVTASWSDAEGGLQAARVLLDLDDPPTGIFCFNDRMAMGVYHAAAERGLRIPDDLSVVGFDNQELIAEGVRPQLSTVALPHYEMGAWAVETLRRHIEDPESDVEQIHLACPLVPRDSVAAPRAG